MRTLLAKKMLEKRSPCLVFVAGSWGKSLVVSQLYSILRKNRKKVVTISSNDLASVIACVKDSFSIKAFLKYFFVDGHYPDIIIVELHGQTDVGAELLAKIEKKTVVLPYISQADLTASVDLQTYLENHCLLPKEVQKSTTIVYNADVEELDKLFSRQAFKKNAIGISIRNRSVDFSGHDIEFRLPEEPLSHDSRVQGMKFKVDHAGSTLPLRLSNVVGTPHVYSSLFALAVAKEIGINLVDSIPIIKDHQSIPGRISLVPGIKKTLLVDDTYDIDPESAFITFDEASNMPVDPGKKRIAVIGDMVHTGADSLQAHCLLGTELARMNYDMLVAIGERGHDLLRCAEEAGMPRSSLHHFLDQVDAGKMIQHELKSGDLVVVKGSKEMKLESIIKELMAFPLRSKEDLLVR